MLDHDGHAYWLVALWSSGHIEFPFRYMMTTGPFADESLRLEFVRRLNAIPGVTIPSSKISGSPYVRLEHFTSEAAQRQLLDTLAWAGATIRAAWQA